MQHLKPLYHSSYLQGSEGTRGDCQLQFLPTDIKISEIPHLSLLVFTREKKNLMTEIISPLRNAALKVLICLDISPPRCQSLIRRLKSKSKTKGGISSSKTRIFQPSILVHACSWSSRQPESVLFQEVTKIIFSALRKRSPKGEAQP